MRASGTKIWFGNCENGRFESMASNPSAVQELFRVLKDAGNKTMPIWLDEEFSILSS